jgi:hypothetical protein
MESMNQPKKFRTIAQFLTEKNGSQVKRIKKWTEEEDQVLLNLLRKRTAEAIRVRIYRLILKKKSKK